MEREVSNDFVKSSYILTLGYLLSSLISSIGTIVVIRLISIEEYSLLNISFIIPAILIVFSELGLNYASTHFIAKKIKENNYKEVRDVIKINLIIKIIVGLIFSILILLYSAYIAIEIYKVTDKRLIILIQIGAIGIFARIILDAMNSFYLGGLKVKVIQIGSILQTSLRTVISIILILCGLGYLGPILGFVLAPLFVVVFYLFFLKRTFYIDKNEKESINWSELTKMVKYGYPLLFLSAVASIQLPIYTYILTISGNLIEVSYLNVAIVSAALIGILTKSISFSLFPIFSKMNWNNNDKEKEKLITYFRFSIKYGTILILPTCLLLFIFSRDIFPIIYGEKYRDASTFISIYFLTFLLVSFGSLTIPAFFNGQKRTQYVLYIQLINLISTVLFSLILIYYIGAIGIAYGIVLGSTVSVICGNILLRKEYGNIFLGNFKNMFFIFIIAIVIGFLTYMLYGFLNFVISANNVFYTVFKLGLAFTFYILIFLFSIGIFSQIDIEEIEFFEGSFKNFPLINKLIKLVCTIERKIINVRIRNKK